MNKTLNMVADVLLIIGGLNWGLVGVADWNLVDSLFGAWPALVSIIYILVGLSALYALWMMFQKEGGM